MIFFLLVALGFLIHAAPSTGPTSICPIEDLPWTISSIVVFTSNISSTNTAVTSGSMGMGMGMAGDTIYSDESFIDFYFCDSNEGLELEMECTRTTNGTLVDDDNFYPCDQRGVVFKYDGSTLEVQRAYKSPCLGEPPYDGAIAFGRADMNLAATTSPNGTIATQTRMEMPISSLS